MYYIKEVGSASEMHHAATKTSQKPNNRGNFDSVLQTETTTIYAIAGGNGTQVQAKHAKNSGANCPVFMEDIFKEAATTYGISIDLLKAVAKAESNFNPNAISKAGAMGVMQLMPGTAKSLGVSDPYNPRDNIMGGAKYLANLLKQYNGDISLALAAYNAGPGNVKKHGGIPPFKETQNYIKKVLAYMNEGVTIPNNASASESVATQTYQYNNSIIDLL